MAEGILRGRSAGIALVIVGALAFAALVAADPGIDPTSPSGSSYSTRDDGMAAYAELLQQSGYTVERTRLAIAQRTIPTGDTIVLLGGSRLSADDEDALSDFVDGGGRLVVAGSVEGLSFAPPRQLGPAPARQRLVFPHPDVAGITEIAVPEAIGFAEWGALIPLFAEGDRASVLIAHAGAGTVFVLADERVLSNAALDQLDNAALGLAMAGDIARGVHFLEYVHGYLPSQGLAAVSGRWRAGGYVLAAALLLWLLAHARRLGPADSPGRAMTHPPRSAYVTALATAMAKSDDKSGALDGLDAFIRRRIAARTGLEPRAAVDEIAATATFLATDSADLALALGAARGDAAVLAVGRVVSDLTRDR